MGLLKNKNRLKIQSTPACECDTIKLNQLSYSKFDFYEIVYVMISRGNARLNMVLRQKMEDYDVERLKFIVSAVPKLWLVWVKLI